MKTAIVYVAATIATLVTGHASNAQTKVNIKGQDVTISEKQAALLTCRFKWNQLKDKPAKSAAELQAIEYGSQYFMKLCKRGQ